MRLLRAEWRRIINRRLTLGVVAMLTVIIAVFSIALWQSSTPPSDADAARAQQLYEQAAADWRENGEQYIADCLSAERDARAIDPAADYKCDEMRAPQQSDYTWTPPRMDATMQDTVSTALPLAAMAALVLAASLISAEFASQSMTTWLTFEPRRGRVMASKLATIVPVSAGLAVLTLALFALATWLSVSLNDGPTQWADGELSRYLLRSLRTVAVVSGVGVLSACLGFLVRHTAAAVGISAGYLVVVELMGRNLWGPLGRWSLGNNMSAAVNGRTAYATNICRTDPQQGYLCEWVEKTITWHQAAPYLLAVLTVLVLLAWITFQRRDVQ